MSWFDEQIKQRKQYDEDVFADSFMNIAGAILGRKMNLALQSDSTVARDAIGEILNFYGIKSKDIPDSITDINEQLEFVLRPHGIMRRDVRLEKGWYRDADGPMLGRRVSDGTAVALIPRKLGGYSFLDLGTGLVTKVNKRNENMIDDEAIVFYNSFPLRKMGKGDLIKYILGIISTSDITFMVGATLVATAIGMLLPKINQLLFGVVIQNASIRMLVAASVFLLCVTISSMLFEATKAIVAGRIEMKMENTVSAATMMRILSLPADFFSKYSSGELTSYVNKMSEMCNMLVSQLFSIGLTSVFSLAYISQIAVFAKTLVVPAITVIIITLLLSLLTVTYTMNNTRKVLKVHARVSGISYALISGVQKIKLSGAEKRAFSKWANEYANEASEVYNIPLFIRINGVINIAITTIGTMVMYYFAVVGNVKVADFYAFNAAYGMLSGSFLSLSAVAMMIAKIKPMFEGVKPIMDAEPEMSEGRTVLSRLSGGIELSNVTFRYNENMPYVLDNLSLKINAGQYVAIVGKTGCGKSTLMRLLLGFEKPQKGAIYFDGKDLNSIDPKSLRRKIGVVLQNGKLFQGDIFSNITISAPWLTVDDAWEAAKIAGIDEDIERMPMGMNTMIVEGTGGISGGQKQRLMIARAIAPKPKILLLDEATSALDNITQKKVSDALDNLKCTRVVIAHRLSTIKQCDRIVVLDKGHIIEDGTYDELIAQNGFFAELVERQRLDYE